jgi:hypothetical protein
MPSDLRDALEILRSLHTRLDCLESNLSARTVIVKGAIEKFMDLFRLHRENRQFTAIETIPGMEIKIEGTVRSHDENVPTKVELTITRNLHSRNRLDMTGYSIGRDGDRSEYHEETKNPRIMMEMVDSICNTTRLDTDPIDEDPDYGYSVQREPLRVIRR